MNILIVSPFFALPLKSGGHTRLFNMIKHISSHHEVDFLSPITDQERDYIPELKGYCRQIFPVSVRNSCDPGHVSGKYDLFRLCSKLGGLLRGIPREVSGFYYLELHKKLNALLKLYRYDIVQVEFTRMAQYFNKSFYEHHPSIKILVDYDMAFIPFQRRWECEKNIFFKIIRYIDYRMNKSYALRMWKLFDSFIVMSEVDRKRTLDHLPYLPVHVVPNGVDLSTYKPLPGTGNGKKCRELLFIGGALHFPNVDALSFFTEEVYPLIHNSIKDISLTVIGSGWESYSKHLSHIPSIRFAGFVKDIRTYASGSMILVAPIRIGGGTRLKILEAMAMGIPVVSTSVGCEGITVEDGRDILIADTPEKFMSRINQIISSADLRQHLTENAYKLVKETYGWDKLAMKMEKIYDDLTGTAYETESA
jgi:glycosyltransferase involved in cell wall biosynthesis